MKSSVVHYFFITFAFPKAALRSVAGILLWGCERKVRAAQGIPLPKLEAIGDSRCRQKKMTARNLSRIHMIINLGQRGYTLLYYSSFISFSVKPVIKAICSMLNPFF